MPGKKLNLSALLYAKNFWYRGYKTGAPAAFGELELAGLGTLDTKKTKSGKVRIVTDMLHYSYHKHPCLYQHIFDKAEVPVAPEDKDFAKKLMKYGVSLVEYS